jgi:hypothetical protein
MRIRISRFEFDHESALTKFQISDESLTLFEVELANINC